MASPHAARLAKAVELLVEVSVGGDRAAIDPALAAVARSVTDIEVRRGVPSSTMVAVFKRDCWTCRYCAGKTIAPAVLRVLSHRYPDQFPYHPNWKAGQVHPACLLLSTTLDHVQPGGRGGSWEDVNNLATACWPCNSGKADFTLEEIGWALLDQSDVQSDWDGLTGAYPALWETAGQPDAAYHRKWLRTLRA